MMTGSTIPQCSVSALAAAVLATAACAGAVLENSSFETVGPLGPSTKIDNRNAHVFALQSQNHSLQSQLDALRRQLESLTAIVGQGAAS